ncbi:hypothetical protein PUNSTDRAFT_119839 [Punctularia strigosozonata HHB-11173 SS5]|uniref:uncharacterized protein n=1 Tax=Punctularia strigosozonata (strain HHB-11173) TaxID=741275 RepID=UPI00044163E8|nr:uncharacterized protein PUNSTDRAFT_119839 [Punctularia strigosozonata HHB-11173 SS5]EIN11025.1 hypothetical protein PUNSTDRAFT_119839 [Punctularia strigosozonata HHB-11173 SS5]
MSAESSSRRSNLIDVTYQQLHSILTGHAEGISPDHTLAILRPRIERLQNIVEPFGTPSEASKKKVNSGTVTLADGVDVQVEDADKEFVFAISDRFNIDQVEALVLLRSFLYNEGLPAQAGTDSTSSLVEELVEAITPFYHSERLSLLRTIIPLFRAHDDDTSPFFDVAGEVVPKIVTDGQTWADSLVTEYGRKTQASPPDALSSDPRGASRWSKQNLREQIVVLEILFWTMWSYVSCVGPLVVRIFEMAYTTSLGGALQDTTLVLDEEGLQLQQDAKALWILIMLEVLELERVADPSELEVSTDPADPSFYAHDPQSLTQLHELLTSSGHPQYSCIYMAWSFVLSRLSEKVAVAKEVPERYRAFFESVRQKLGSRYTDREPVHILMARRALGPDVGLFQLMLDMLLMSPLFVTSIAWRTGSTVTDPNAVAFRSVLKGLLIAILELVPVELMPDFDALVEVWVALFGRSEPQSVAGICRQFWQVDWHTGNARRAILDVARARFPIQSRPLIRLLRSMTASGFLDTDPLSTGDVAEGTMDEEREICDQHVFYYLDKLPTFTQAIPISACTGPNALFEKAPDRYKDGNRPAGLKYTNTRSLRLPGGSVLPAKSVGRLLSGDGGDVIIVAWQHEHSGWKLLLEILTDYVHRKRPFPGSRGPAEASTLRRGKPDGQPLPLRLEDVGLEHDEDGDEALVTDALDLIRSVIRDEPVLAEQLLQSMEAGEPVVAHTMSEAQPPDLVQLAAMILEEAFSRSASQRRVAPRTNLITSAMSILSELLALPKYSNRVWLYIRSTAILFGSDRASGSTSSILAAERITGHYTMTLALLHLVQHLFYEASSSLLPVVAENSRLQTIKEEVLLRATRFVHAEIWVEHSGWKYVHLGDRFEIGRRISVLYTEVLKQSPSGMDQPFATLRLAIVEALLSKATPSTIGPLVNIISSASPMLTALYASRRYGDARRLIFLLEAHLRLIRTLLEHRSMIPDFKGVSLLEQLLCARGPANGLSLNGARAQVDHIETLASYIKDRGMGNVTPLEATRVLHTLCASLASSFNTPTIVGHLSNPEATVASFVRIVQHPYDDLALRTSLWDFMAMAVDKEPALAGLFIHGEFRIPDVKGKGKAVPDQTKNSPVSALDTALDMLGQWKELWNLNPQILASVLRFIVAVWQHGMEHQSALESRRKDAELWACLAAIAQEDLGPAPDYQSESWINDDGVRHSPLHDAVSSHAYHTITKSRALHIIGLDVDMHLQLRDRKDQIPDRPASYQAIEGCFKDEDQFTDCVLEAAASPYDPGLYDKFIEDAKARYGHLSLRQLQNQTPLVEHEYGDDYMFSIPLLQRRLIPYRLVDEVQAQEADELERILASINLNLSLTNAQSCLTESWQYLLLRVVPFLRGQASTRKVVLTLAVSISGNIASDSRSGDMMAAIHGQRLSLLLAMLEVAWFSTTDTADEIQHFTDVVQNLRDIIVSDAQSPAKAVIGRVPIPFHKPLLQIIYFCVRHCRALIRRPKALNAQQRLIFASTVDIALVFTVDALRCVFEAARSRLDLELDQDLELLVAVFEQCTRTDITPSAAMWLARCQESDVVRCSMELFVHSDIAGLADLELLRVHRRPLYSLPVLMFHLALASIPAAAEKLASEGVLVAYSNNSISSSISSGSVEVSLPELPGERSPAHEAYCTMLAIVSGVVGTLGRQHHFFDAEASGLVQLYGGQISRALSWSVGDALTMPLVEEMEQVVELFSAIADSTPHSATSGTAAEKVLKAFASHALFLLQQLTYALTHPNQLAGSLEPISAEERSMLEQDSRDTSSSTLIVNPARRPFLARVIHRLYGLSSTILATLLSITHAEDVLIGDEEDWPIHMALAAPHTKVIPGEPASMGTLLELGNASLDVLRHLSNQPVGQAISPAASTSPLSKPLDVGDAMSTAARNLENVLVFAVTQFAMWLARPNADELGEREMQVEDFGGSDEQRSERERRAARRTSLTLAERMRRGMTGEMAGDLQALLGKVKPLLEKTRTALKTDKEDVDLTDILVTFLHDRMLVASQSV